MNNNKKRRVEIFETFIETIKNKFPKQLGESFTVSLTADELNAFKFVANSLQGQVKGWKSGGKPRDENPTRDGLYLRKYRAGLVVKEYERKLSAGHLTAAESLSLKRKLKTAETAFKSAEADYADFMKKRTP